MEHDKSPVRVWCDGCFDLVHYGHANSLRQAKLMGDELVVGVHNDADIQKFKGPPVFLEEERYKMVRGIKWVDEVVEGSTYWPTVDTLKENGCAFAAHGDDLSISTDGRDPYAALRDSGVLRIFKRTIGVSTTDLVGRMLLMTTTHHYTKNIPTDVVSQYQEPDNSMSKWTKCTKFLPSTNRIVEFSKGNVEPNDKDVVVYVCGDFDLLHPGHLDFLEAAKKQGDYLVVGLNTDQVVNARKGFNYPLMNLHERALSLLACRYVDEVIIGAPYEVSAGVLDQLNVSVVCHGMNGLECVGGIDPLAEAKQRGILKIIDTGNRQSTRDIVRRVIEHRLDFELRNAKKEKREADVIEDILERQQDCQPCGDILNAA